jgi:exopolysaccharide biosynthesis polyprenyl glycosylphosphotransferase
VSELQTSIGTRDFSSPLEIQRLVDQTAKGRHWRDALLRRMLALADSGAVLLVSVFFAFAPGGGWHLALWSAALLPIWILLAKLTGLYDNDHRALRHLTVDEFPQIFMWALQGSVIAGLIMYWLPSTSITVDKALEMLGIVLVAGFAFRGAMRVAWRRIVPAERTMIVGDGPLAEATRRKIELFPDIHVELNGAHPDLQTDELESWVRGVDRVILASQRIDEEQIADLVALCRRRQIKLSVIPPARGMFGTAVQLNHVADLPVVEYNTWDVSRSTVALKRILDISIALPAVVLLSPVFLLIALAIAVDSRGPIIISRPRAGLHGRPFRMHKFRTMVADAAERLPELVSLADLPEPMFKLQADPRVTRVGRFLRRTSLDELPQFFNVLRGEMALVGPRPEDVELVELYQPAHRFRLHVKPGMTGPMQIYGRGQLGFHERLAVEREYIENLAVSRDLRILALTVAAVVSGRGAY